MQDTPATQATHADAAPAPRLTPDQIAALTLSAGSHSSPDSGHCLLEVVSMFAGERFGDSPACVDPVLAAFGRAWNDAMATDAEREQLKQYVTLLPGTNHGPELSLQRSFMALDWFMRVHAPMWLEQVPELAEHAATLRALAPITAELGEAERMAAIDKAAQATRAARATRATRATRAARAARATRATRATRAAWAAWAAWDARAARAAWAAWDTWAAWEDAAAAAAQVAAYEAAKGSASYEEARAKADAVFDQHRDAVREQLHGLYLSMINAELREVSSIEGGQS